MQLSGKIVSIAFCLSAVVVPVQFCRAQTVLTSQVTGPVGVVGLANTLLVSDYTCTHVYSVDSAGTATLFASLPIPSGLAGITNCEDYLAISRGLGGFPANYVYATQGPNVYQISPDGSQVTLFTVLPGVSGYLNVHTSITFDNTGTFGDQMIVTSSDGGPSLVYTVNSSGIATQMTITGADSLNGLIGTQVEGPEVAPSTINPYGGYLFVAAEKAGGIYAISPSGAMSALIPVPGSPEAVRFVPQISTTSVFTSTFNTETDHKPHPTLTVTGEADFSVPSTGVLQITIKNLTQQPYVDSENIGRLDFELSGFSNGTLTGISGEIVKSLAVNSPVTKYTYVSGADWKLTEKKGKKGVTNFELSVPFHNSPYEIIGAPGPNGEYSNIATNPYKNKYDHLEVDAAYPLFFESATFTLSIPGVTSADLSGLSNVIFSYGPDGPDKDDISPAATLAPSAPRYVQNDLSASKVVEFSSSQLAGFVGTALVPDEDSNAIYSVAFPSLAASLFAMDNAVGPFFHEGGTIVANQ